MKDYLKVNVETGTLIMDRTFAKKAMIVGSDDYNLLQNARRDYPSYKVVQRQIKRNSDKESYRGLTYAYMEYYIANHENSKKNMDQYREMRLLAECHSIRYPHIKKWFLNTYPEVTKFGMDTFEEDQTISLVTELAG